ncbi:uncharacterized protein LOC127858276 [Dreissena polymorpha]|uniref:uncharacterized protein LOC127858276 n=1 Tax=Dreissena polymorpha TaxID=45954 RepID=UPI0022644989|nr:uncharacterized protein LOC127858276 [Dreissena polymorpha]XP_052251229.1 uncharacterized protein LOC127858276 [Dreissena polymorpha]
MAGCPSINSPRNVYHYFLEDFFSHKLVIAFGVAFAITRLTYGLVEVSTTLCTIEKYASILLVTKGFIELIMLWAPLVIFRFFDMVERASINPCFEIYVYVFTLTEFVLLVLEIVWCSGYYTEMKSTCNSADPNWKVHFGNFVISQTVIDGLVWIGTIFSLCFRMFDIDYANHKNDMNRDSSEHANS